jgi:CDP-paratose 2-epimerase
MTIFGTGKQVRDIIYVNDVCEAFDAFYNTRKPGIYNIGGGLKSAISLMECIDLIGEISGTKPEVIFAPERNADLRYFVCDTSNARRELRWSPRIYPKDGLFMLINWIKDNRSILEAKAR